MYLETSKVNVKKYLAIAVFYDLLQKYSKEQDKKRKKREEEEIRNIGEWTNERSMKL